MEGLFFSQTITTTREYLGYSAAAPMFHSSHPAPQSFKKIAQRELKTIRSNEKQKDVINVFSCYDRVDHTAEEKQSLLLSLAAQDYVISPWKKRLTSCTKVGVFYKQKFLWYTSRLEKNTEPLYLNKKQLEGILREVFGNVCLQLGELMWESAKFIAWQFKTEDGQEFLIPWHNASLVPQTPEMAFVAKSFKELKSTYQILRFRELQPGESYSILLV